MMDVQANEVELEDGELSESGDEEIYKPLLRPTSSNMEKPKTTSPLATCHQIQTALEDDDDESQDNSDSSISGSSSDGLNKKLRFYSLIETNQRKRKKRVHRTVMVRVGPTNDNDMLPNRARFRKYNIWTAALQEEALTENMRGCDVTYNPGNDRNVENYDFSLRYRLTSENSLKRRLSNSTDDELHPIHKRGRTSQRTDVCSRQSRSVKARQGHRSSGNNSQLSSTSASSSDNSCDLRRHVLDLDSLDDRDPLDIAKEMAHKLQEEKDDLMVRIVQVLGLKIPIEIYKETQRIEADGGMMIKNGKRRRTPGGVFLFLLKHHDSLTVDQQKSIFSEGRKMVNISRKEIESIMRDRKVKELKKCLKEQGNDLPALNSRKDIFLLGSELSADNQPGNLSNPPPSPVGQGQSSPEYKTHAINVVVTETPSTSAAAVATLGDASTIKEISNYEDDFLDINYTEMDLF